MNETPVITTGPRVLADEFPGIQRELQTKPTEEVLAWAWQRLGKRAAIGTSFQGAGLVMMHIASTRGFQFPVFTLDTGLLFPETLELRNRLEQFFGFKIESLVPESTVEQQATIHGPELWARDPDLCCTLRKVLPLRERLEGLDCWITGLRWQQSATRSSVGVIERYIFDEDSGREILKLNPMAAWSRDAVWEYLRKHQIPYNPLHDRGYHSIGCQPCTRLTAGGEDERAGRWTGFSKTECGIHTFLGKRRDVAN
jgi:phosphoadenosine phosphosulfate reductase